MDAVDDPLQQYGYKKRIKAMAYYLFQTSQGNLTQLGEVLGYFLGEESINMGNWSDGQPVNEAYTTDDPYGVRGELSLVGQIQDSSDELCTPVDL
ncbi:MAG: hypothetical protein IH840_15555 [Candidatus Heimdallarchaeota archaeon]|nr:hypothetical protein [Candidatus Heimdallarchaeota archaeon]